jgi:CRP-like cAMP-binding protein
MYEQDSQPNNGLNDLSEQQAELLRSAFEPFAIPRGMPVFEQGQTADYLYILSSGKVIIRYKPYDGPPLTVATIGPGDVCGWSVVLGRPLYSSEAVVVEDSQGFRISRTRLDELCICDKEALASLMKRLAGRVNDETDPSYTEILKVLNHGMSQNEDCQLEEVHNDQSDSSIQY